MAPEPEEEDAPALRKRLAVMRATNHLLEARVQQLAARLDVAAVAQESCGTGTR